MRQYKTNIQETVELDKIICNKCGKEIKVIRGVAQEDYLEVTKRWGYFSNKDMQKHTIVLCEECYDSWTQELMIPPIVTDDTEPLITEGV